MPSTAAVGPKEIEQSDANRMQLPPMKMPASSKRWALREVDPRTIAGIEAEIGCPRALARLLAGRGVRAGEADKYLNPSLRDSLPDPSSLVDMDRAAARLGAAILAGERCGVFGDYDVDGTSGSAILKGYFDALGAPLDVYLPDRILEGYGPTIEAFRTLKDAGVRIIITVDCGAAAHLAVDAAAREGLEIIILDHHQMDGPPPAGAFATVNPNRKDDCSGLSALSAAGVAFMTIVAINRTLKDAGFFAERKVPDLLQFLDLVALGLVCDVMPMTGLARILTAQGLKVLNSGGNPGLKALGKRAGVSASASAYDLGFLLGPRINAAGRVGHANLAFELLTTGDTQRRSLLAERLHVMNAERQQIEKEVQDAAMELIGRRGLDRSSVIVVAGEGWHPGVIGIVAGRIKERFDRPTIVIGVDGAIGKGSARSLYGVDIGAAFRAAKDQGLLISGGGHAMAAGLTIDASAIGDFANFLETHCKGDVEAALMNQVCEIDDMIAPSAVSGVFADLIARAGPFGPGNSEPVFVLASMRVDRPKVVGGSHLACELVSPTGEKVRAIAFRAVGEALGAILLGGARTHIAGRIKADAWRGGGAAQFQIVDAASAAS